MGLRYRVSFRPQPQLRRTADIVFPRLHVAVFIDGCFWRACPEHGTVSRANATYWSDKLARIVARDADTTTRLQKAGWTVMRFWEQEYPAHVAASIAQTVSAARCQGWAPGKSQDTGDIARESSLLLV